MSAIAEARRKAEREEMAARQPSLDGMSLDEVKAMLADREHRRIPGVPDWAQGGTPTQRSRAARGLHPMGLRMANNGETCGSCAHYRSKEFHGKTYRKCEKMPDTNGPGTDIRKKWPACEAWTAKTGGAA